jgi:hypothetical protein
VGRGGTAPDFYGRSHGAGVSFIRKKRVHGRVYRYEVESVRAADGSVTQKVLRYLGAEQPIYGTDKERRRPKKDA